MPTELRATYRPPSCAPPTAHRPPPTAHHAPPTTHQPPLIALRPSCGPHCPVQGIHASAEVPGMVFPGSPGLVWERARQWLDWHLKGQASPIATAPPIEIEVCLAIPASHAHPPPEAMRPPTTGGHAPTHHRRPCAHPPPEAMRPPTTGVAWPRARRHDAAHDEPPRPVQHTRVPSSPQQPSAAACVARAWSAPVPVRAGVGAAAIPLLPQQVPHLRLLASDDQRAGVHAIHALGTWRRP
jgi:hypothetical protein